MMGCQILCMLSKMFVVWFGAEHGPAARAPPTLVFYEDLTGPTALLASGVPA